MKTLWTLGVAVAMAAVGVASGCGSHANESPEGGLGPTDGGLEADVSTPPAALLDPQSCQTCHPNHVSDWSASMHAYASQDPVFLAMNRRMQRENPSLGPFCIKCHAPMALALGMTDSGLNLPALAAQCGDKSGCGYLGVTCYFCHNIESVDATHAYNAAVTLANDNVMRGEITNPVANSVHQAKYSELHDEAKPESATLCGACHDIVSPVGGAIERTFTEWQHSAFSGLDDAGPIDPNNATTCAQSGCHMVQSAGKVAIAAPGSTLDGGAPPTNRYFHAHDFPAVDQAVTPFATPALEATEQSRILTNLQNGLQEALCVAPPGLVSVVLDTVNLGHNFPSGAAQDRRLWAEVIARDASGNVLYQSGVVPDGVSPVDVGKTDPDMWLMRDCMFGEDGGLVDMFWQGHVPDGNELPPLTAFLPNAAAYLAHKVRLFPRNGSPLTDADGGYVMPASVTLRLRLQPIGIDVLNDLVDSGDLDAGFVASLPPSIDVPFVLPDGGTDTTLTWTAAAAAAAGIDLQTAKNACVGTLTTAASQYPAATHTSPACTP
jgi:hypothetical protein